MKNTNYVMLEMNFDGKFALIVVEGWRKADGGNVKHADIWRQIDRWMEKFAGSEFEDSGPRTVTFVHVRAHTGVEGNERADRLAAKGANLRHTRMVDSQPKGWFRQTVERY